MPKRRSRRQQNGRGSQHRGNHNGSRWNNHRRTPQPSRTSRTTSVTDSTTTAVSNALNHHHQRSTRHHSDGSIGPYFGSKASEGRHMVYKQQLQRIRSSSNKAQAHLANLLSSVDELDKAFKSNMEWEPCYINTIVKHTPSDGSDKTVSLRNHIHGPTAALLPLAPPPTSGVGAVVGGGGGGVAALPLSPRSRGTPLLPVAPMHAPLLPPPPPATTAAPAPRHHQQQPQYPHPQQPHQNLVCPSGTQCLNVAQPGYPLPYHQRHRLRHPTMVAAAGAVAPGGGAVRACTPMDTGIDGDPCEASSDETLIAGPTTANAFALFREPGAGGSGGRLEM